MQPRAKPDRNRFGLDRVQHVKAVHPPQNQIHDQDIWGPVLHHLDGLLAVAGLSYHFQALLGLERVGEDGTEFLAGVSNENGFLRFHACMSPPVGKRLCQLPQIFQMM